MPEVAHRVLAAEKLESLISGLRRRGYRVIGPTLRDGAILYEHIERGAQLPAGWSDEQAPGRYRVARRPHSAFFAYGNGPLSWKRYLHPPEVALFTAARHDGGFRILNNGNGNGSAAPYAFLGVHACDLAAIRVLERVFAETDPGYAARREQTFIVAIQCTHAGATCFCAAMKTGPRLGDGYDLALAEFHGPPHRFVVWAGTPRGAELLAELETAPASPEDVRELEAGIARSAAEQTCTLDAAATHALLERAAHDAHWDKVAARCFACGNCTLVCPTCFCTTIEDASDVTGQHAARCRRWDSCFTLGFSYIHGGSVRASVRARYRQWLTHKLDTWLDQFGSHGCVGCGRCITWCPAGIDITAEIRTLQEIHHGDA